MAAPAALLAAKAALAALSDERGRKVIGGIVIAILSPVILMIVVIVSMANATADHNNAALKLSFEGGVIWRRCKSSPPAGRSRRMERECCARPSYCDIVEANEKRDTGHPKKKGTCAYVNAAFF